MVKRILCLFLFCVSAAHAASEVRALERLLLEEDIVLAHQKMNLKVSLNSRNLWYQQGLMVMIDLTSSQAMPSLSVNMFMSNTEPWQNLSIQPEPSYRLLDGAHHYHWQAMVFPKQLGVQALPTLRLRLAGTSGAQKTISLPSLSVYVRSLPVYVPAEAWVGKADAPPTLQNDAGWVLVGDQQTQTWQWQVQGLWSKAVNLPILSGQGIAGLQPWFDVQHVWQDGQYWTYLRVQQPWAATEMGRWSIASQDFWLFDPQTGKVQHWRISGGSGYALTPWLWRVIQGIVLLIGLGLLLLLMLFIRCRLRQQHYRQGIAQAADAEQLLRWLRVQWRLRDGIPMAHQAQGLPIAAALIALEGMLFDGKPLHTDDFIQVRAQLMRVKLKCHVFRAPTQFLWSE